ncbi:N-terminal Xaa-Pro-Lys N-methyltransferase 1-A [Aplysia californica]|uniref:Alpha N-terminal protein methyltransferase 1 n=1 Tax=Aplysia californica TaxID=6500 RepID=A0ABM0JZ53_APLCA|nr:N-terminal Xaa-Pro-Lys N-methyltransferase 1-A [Aplysia californica]
MMAAPSENESGNDLQDRVEKFYEDAKGYWASVTPTVDGMLGGFAKISPTDINGSKSFLRQFLKISGGSLMPNRALDCGAGIGRITKRLLLPIFDTVDMVEQDQHFCDNAREFIGSDSSRVENIFCSGLQDFTPAEQGYDLIWCQWVLGHLEDDHLVKFFQRCQKGLREGGVLIVKENTLESDKRAFDDSDSSYTRPKWDLEMCMINAGLKVLSVQKQKGFPKDIYPVYMFALQ